MSRILEDRDSHALVQTDDGDVQLVPWSDRNKLLYKHGLADVVDEGGSILTLRDDGDTITITPHDDATEFTIEVGDYGAHVGQHEKSEFLEALLAAYENADRHGPDAQPIREFVAGLLDVDVNPQVVDDLAEVPPFEGRVEVRDDGWLIHDHVLLTYDNEFYHPETTRKSRSGGVVSGNANKEAYQLRFKNSEWGDVGQTDLSMFSGIGDAGEHVKFVSMALWAVQYTSEVNPNE